ncbi:AAA family ATPase [Mucilaginibacter pocheonensis]|uniref:ATPase n=1 Tax=Mucilaginibacter pocheonensis TaxID=398050 RepID=A0ABU1TCD2_9SPHI|nr:AAA family ATPase [Mucilaginibacter pocheonensis]MDR6942949.1 putative ATPase [Mucilaginibacter pocheonensis]
MIKALPYLQEICLDLSGVTSFDEYPFDIPSIRNLKSLSFDSNVTFIVGENGSGKSTLIEAIALLLGFSLQGGSKNFQYEEGQNLPPLFRYLNGIKSFKQPKDFFFLRAETFHNVSTTLEELYAQKKDVLLKNYGIDLIRSSHGEAFMAVLANKLKGRGLYIFDEPEAALSPSRQLAAVHLIDSLVKKDSQFIIATHSPILLAYPNAVIYQFGNEGIRKIDYEETEHFMVMKYFINNYHEIISEVIREDIREP